jgi:hypothetical protein
MLRRGSRAYTEFASRRQQNVGWAIRRPERSRPRKPNLLFGAAHIFVCATEPIIERDKLSAARVG